MVPSEDKGEHRDDQNLWRRRVEKAMGTKLKRKRREDMGGKERARSEPHGDADGDDKRGDIPMGRCNQRRELDGMEGCEDKVWDRGTVQD